MCIEGHKGKHSQNSLEEVVKMAHILPDIKTYNKAIIFRKV